MTTFARTALVASFALAAMPAPALAGEFILEQASTSGAIGTGCSAALVDRVGKATIKAKKAADLNLLDHCAANWLSEAQCDGQCATRAWDFGRVESTNNVYTFIDDDPEAACGYWVKYSVHGNCACYCWNDYE